MTFDSWNFKVKIHVKTALSFYLTSRLSNINDKCKTASWNLHGQVLIFFLYCKTLKWMRLSQYRRNKLIIACDDLSPFFINWIRTSIGRNWLRVPINTTRKPANNSSSRKWSGSAARQYGNYSKASVCFWWIIWWSLNT